MNADETLGRRKEPRFKTCDDELLECNTFVDFDDPIEGTVIDISPNGLRFLCDGKFGVGQAFLTELKTDRLHGVFPGVIRRVEPWVDGKTVLGCQLLETIPDDVLETLAHEDVIDRRRDERVAWNQAAKMSWELQPGEVDIQIQHCSLGGLQICSPTTVPDDVRVRIRVELGDQEHVIVDAKAVWQMEREADCLLGLAFTNREVPGVIARILAQSNASEGTARNANRGRSVRRSLLVAAAIVVFALAISQTALWG